MAMTTIDLRTRPSQPSATDTDSTESFRTVSPQSPQFEIPGQLWGLRCVGGALLLVSTILLFMYGQGSIGI